MNMHVFDWGISIFLLALMTVAALWTKRFTRTVADFLAANRCGGRYLLATAEGAANTGAIYFMAMFEMHYSAGFTAAWWRLMMFPAAVLIALSGWVVYRFRQTRAMTMAQFFEIRYSKRFRIFTGILAWACGTLNFGIFPAVGARFFIYFCGLPDSFNMFGVFIPSFPLVMFILISIALFFTFLGGQIAIMVTDFIQGVFSNVAGIILLVILFGLFSWNQIGTALMTAPAEASLIHPFHTGQVKDFNVWYFLISVFVLFYCHLSWQGSQGFNCSAKSPHEARMGKIIGSFREAATIVPMILLPIFAYTLMHHANFTSQAASANAIFAKISNPSIRTQMTIPVALSQILPVGAIGLMCTIILAAFLANCEAYLHSWGSIFIQDVILPLRKKPLTPKEHIKLLRISIIGIAVFVFCWSLLFKQTTQIFFYFAITGTIYLGGSGAAIIGGLYWKRGTTSAAWVAMILGATLGVAGILIYEFYPNFPINGQVMWFIAMASSAIAYIVISLAGKQKFNMDQMLHRGKYSLEQDTVVAPDRGSILLERLGITREFSRLDKVVFAISIAWTFMWILVFVCGILFNVFTDVSNESWLKFWKIWVVVNVVYCVLVSIWLTLGGLFDLKKMFMSLAKKQRDASDDGVVGHDGSSRTSLVNIESTINN